MNRARLASLLAERSPLYAIGDQLGMVGANFILGVIVARSGTLEDFAQFGVLYALLVLLNFLHGPMLNEPLVLSSAAGGKARSRSSLRVTFLIFLPAAGLIALAAALQVTSVTPFTLILLFLAGSGSVMYWSTKAELHCALRHRSAFGATVLTSFAMIACALLAMHHGMDASNAAILAIAVSSVIGAIAGQRVNGVRHGRLEVSASFRHARIGVPSAAMLWLAANGTILLLAHLGRLDDLAGLRVVLALLIPVNQVLIGLSSFLLPRFARQGSGAGAKEKRRLGSLMVFCCLAALLFSGAVLLCGDVLLGLVYGSDYARFAPWLSVGACVLPLCWVTITLLRTRLRGLGDGRRLLGIYGLSLAVGLPLSFLLLDRVGGMGPILSFSLIQVCIAIAFLISFLRKDKVTNGG